MKDELNLLYVVLRHAKGVDPVRSAQLNCRLEQDRPIFQVVLQTENQTHATGWWASAEAAFAHADAWPVAT